LEAEIVLRDVRVLKQLNKDVDDDDQRKIKLSMNDNSDLQHKETFGRKRREKT
jgi:hypothetical protein